MCFVRLLAAVSACYSFAHHYLCDQTLSYTSMNLSSFLRPAGTFH